MRDLNLIGLRDAITSRVVTFANKILANGNQPLLSILGSFPPVVSTIDTDAVKVLLTTAATSSSKNQQGLSVYINPGAGTVGKPVFSIFGRMNVPYGGTANVDFAGFTSGLAGQYTANGGSLGIGVAALAKSGGGTINTHLYAILGVTQDGGTNSAGVAGYDRTSSSTGVGVLGVIGSTSGPITTTPAAGLFDNVSSGKPIIIARENGSPVFTIDTLGNIKLSRTITAAGTTGAQTINKPAGTVNFAAAAGSLVLTNSLITASSIVLLTIRTNDATMKSAIAVCAAGSCTITPNAAPTAETSVGFLVIN